jgi:hypothetical protein
MSPISSSSSVPPLAASNSPATVAVGAGERAFAIAEQFAFQQVFRDRRAVLHDERLGAARAAIVNRARDDFLAGAGFAAQQHGVRAVQDFADQRMGLAHRRAFADQAIATDARYAARHRRRFRQRLTQALQQMQLAKHERAELAERIGEALQLVRRRLAHSSKPSTALC